MTLTKFKFHQRERNFGRMVRWHFKGALGREFDMDMTSSFDFDRSFKVLWCSEELRSRFFSLIS